MLNRAPISRKSCISTHGEQCISLPPIIQGQDMVIKDLIYGFR